MPRIDVYLTSDIEFNVNGAFTRPDRFQPLGADSVFRQVNGQGEGIARLLAPLIEYGLPATHFVETLQSHYFGTADMKEVVAALRTHQQGDLQLHLHPAWAYCKSPEWRKDIASLRKNDSLLDRDADADALIRDGIRFFEDIVGTRPLAVRTGNHQIDRRTLKRFAACGIGISSSVGIGIAVPRDASLQISSGLARIDGVLELPVTSMRSFGFRGAGWRLLTVIGTPFSVMRRILDTAGSKASGPVVFLTHASEFADLPAASTSPQYKPLPVIRKRWQALCHYLASHPERFNLRHVSDLAHDASPTLTPPCTELADTGSYLFAHRLREHAWGH